MDGKEQRGKSLKEINITEELIKTHGLSGKEYKRIVEMMGREPSLTELGIFSVMWSEHCSYKSSRIHLKGFPTEGECVIQGPGENAGVIDIGDDIAVVFKIESHNHPSFIEPYQGATTGVGGILRDIFTMGARPIAIMDSLRFGSLSVPKNRYLFDRVVEGIAGYGNCFGVPTVGGEVYFDDTYAQNPLVNAFALGISHKDKIFYGKASGDGNPVIYVGSKTGKDGIHGATMASEEFDETSDERRPAVQVGDPFTGKLLMEACLEAAKTDYIIGIQDMGAAGLTCSTCEMAGRSGNGIEIDISLVPQREEGMSPYEIMLSESQERMLFVVEKGREEEAVKIFKKWDVEAAVIGKVTNTGRMSVSWQGNVVADIPVNALTDEAPVYDRPAKEPAYIAKFKPACPGDIPESEYGNVLLRLLALPSIASKRSVYEQYDHMVRLNTVTKPGSDAAVLRVPGSKKGLAMSVDCNSEYCYLDPKVGAKIAVCEAARNVACSGAKPLAVTNCLNFGNPEKPETMWQLTNAIKGISEACEALSTPVTGGNVSLYNETLGEGIKPTPVIGVVGILEDVTKRVTQNFKYEGDLLYMLGETREEWGGSQLLAQEKGLHGDKPPHIDLESEKRLHDLLIKAASESILESAHDCSEGGLAVCLAEACISSEKKMGVRIRFEPSVSSLAFMFAESQSRVVVSIPPTQKEKFELMAGELKVPACIIGMVSTGGYLEVNDWFRLRVDEMTKTWDEGLLKV